MQLNEKIAVIRKEHKLSQEEFANQFCVSRQAVSKWENGNAVPDIKTLTQIADYAGISLDELVREDYEYPLKKDIIKEDCAKTGMEEEPEADKNTDVKKEASWKQKLYEFRLGNSMQSEKSKTRSEIATLAWSYLHWWIVLGMSIVAFVLQFAFLVDTGEDYSGWITYGDIYTFNPVTFLLGVILFLAGYYVFWKLFLRGDWERFIGEMWIWKAGFVIISVTFLLKICLAYYFVFLLLGGWDIAIQPEWMLWCGVVFPVYALMISIVDLCVKCRKI